MENIFMDNTGTTLDPTVIDSMLALTVAQQGVACSHFTPSTMLNPSPLYSFANNPGYDSCSNQSVAELNPGQVFVKCQFSNRNYVCPYYSPHYQIITKHSLNDNRFYYLTRFRSYSGSYTYKIYDSNSNVYQVFEYTNLSIKDNDLDSEALALFNLFLKDSMLETKPLNDVTDSVSSKPQKTSYLSTLVS